MSDERCIVADMALLNGPLLTWGEALWQSDACRLEALQSMDKALSLSLTPCGKFFHTLQPAQHHVD